MVTIARVCICGRTERQNGGWVGATASKLAGENGPDTGPPQLDARPAACGLRQAAGVQAPCSPAEPAPRGASIGGRQTEDGGRRTRAEPARLGGEVQRPPVLSTRAERDHGEALRCRTASPGKLSTGRSARTPTLLSEAPPAWRIATHRAERSSARIRARSWRFALPIRSIGACLTHSGPRPRARDFGSSSSWPQRQQRKNSHELSDQTTMNEPDQRFRRALTAAPPHGHEDGGAPDQAPLGGARAATASPRCAQDWPSRALPVPAPRPAHPAPRDPRGAGRALA